MTPTAIMLLLCSSGPVQMPAAPNTLTANEIASGVVQLFDGETTFGWTVDGTASVTKQGTILLGGEKASSITTTMGYTHAKCRYQASADGRGWVTGTAVITDGKLTNDTLLPERVPMPDIKISSPADGRMRFETTAGVIVQLRSITLAFTDMTPLFTGRDLTGWKQNKDKGKDSSAYTVTKDGFLNVKNGPGDLQTTGQWADFAFQVECISNGKHLNSGIFFRCLPELYQQGYEAQIRNQWDGDDRKKPVDFGTGAIYRRQPTRKVVSTDGEWFTLTIAARGRRISTWVNGYPTVDWLDDREEKDNARQGAKLGKGAISIQGHDPTTDLSFRNFRIRSWDK